MKVNRLIPHSTFMELSPADRRVRRTGRSTATALRIIAQCINTPNKPIQVTDHHGTREANRFLLDTIRILVGRMGLKYFVFDDAKQQVRCDIYENRD